MPILVLLLHLLFVSPPTAPKASQTIGQWVSKDKDLKIEVFERDGIFYGKMIWFSVEAKNKTMEDFKDVNNPNKSLKNRQWKDMVVLQGLKYNSEGCWSDGKIYDPNLG
ncbi:MAG: hypothetical protein ACI9V1_001098 [Spirosomataceae bacterium]|jgi:hypothetical protein